MHSNNYGLHTLYIEEQMAQAALRMGQSDYLPDIALFGKQTLYAHGLPSNLLPRTVVGVAFTWNLFDGLHRERDIAQSRLERQALAYTREQSEAILATTVSELYATLTRTLADTRVLTSTIALNEELARMRRIAFAEGMATSTEVVDAENALSQARLDLLAAYYLYHITLTNLQALCGII
jgi:outer membrane protein TolC